MTNHHVGMSFLNRNLDLPVNRIRTGKFTFRNDMTEAETTTIIPSRIIDNLRSKRLHDSSRNRDAITIEHVIIIDHILRYHFINMAGRMDCRADIANVNRLTFGYFMPHHMYPFGIMDDFFRNEQLAVYQATELCENFFHILAKLCGMKQITANFFVITKRSAAMNERIVISFRQTLCFCCYICLVEIT